jgi:peptide/nickel transport system substrate-binding protein
MRRYFFAASLAAILAVALAGGGCRKRNGVFTIALFEKISSLDPIGSPEIKASNERIRVLIFNSLVKKNEKFDYVPDLASGFQASQDGTVYTFTLPENVKFHNGHPLTSADAKYTLETLLASNKPKAASFFDYSGGQRQPHVSSIEAPDAKTLVIRLTKPWQPLLSNLVPVAIIPEGSAASQITNPVGTGPYKFVSFDSSQGVIDLAANNDYWEGAPNIKTIRVRPIEDANALQAELNSGRVDLAPFPTNLSPDTIAAMAKQPELKVVQAPGSNLTYLNFNVQSAPLNNVSVRQAIAYAIDREKIVNQLLLGQAKVAHSILPENSWAYSPGPKYNYDPEKAKQLLDQAGFRDADGDGPQMRFSQPISYKVAATSMAARQYAGVIQDFLKQVGIPINIETVETAILIQQQTSGQFQLASGNWVGGNQDPVFLKDLFASSEIPTADHPGRNRSRYSNPEFDRIIEEAISTIDREKAFGLYSRAQDIIGRDVPMLPLWYPANIVIARKNVANIQIEPSGDWGFIRSLRVE